MLKKRILDTTPFPVFGTTEEVRDAWQAHLAANQARGTVYDPKTGYDTSALPFISAQAYNYDPKFGPGYGETDPVELNRGLISTGMPFKTPETDANGALVTEVIGNDEITRIIAEIAMQRETGQLGQ